MVSKMNYDDRYDKALKYIFGRTLICRNLEAATQLAKTNRLDCVTMDGDQVRGPVPLTVLTILSQRILFPDRRTLNIVRHFS